MIGRYGIGLIVFLVVFPVLARPVIIHDTGHTQSIAPYMEPLQQVTLSTEPSSLSVPPTQPNLSVIQNVLPVHTPEMRPGRLDGYPLDPAIAERLRRLPRSLFLIGADQRSQKWLLRYRDQLKTLGAVGMLIEVETETDLQAMIDLGEGLPIVPASASELAQALGLTHYPVLISQEGIEQ